MTELFRLSAHLNPMTLWETNTGMAIIARDKAEKDTNSDDEVVTIKIIKRLFANGEGEEIIFILHHPKGEGEIIVTPQKAKKIRRGEAEFPVRREQFLKLWPEGIVHLLFLLSWIEKFLKVRFKGYEPAVDKWIMTLLG